MQIYFNVVTEKKACQVCSKTEVMLILSLIAKFVVHHVAEGLPINQYFYLQVLRHLHDAVCLEQPQSGNVASGKSTVTTCLLSLCAEIFS